MPYHCTGIYPSMIIVSNLRLYNAPYITALAYIYYCRIKTKDSVMPKPLLKHISIYNYRIVPTLQRPTYHCSSIYPSIIVKEHFKTAQCPGKYIHLWWSYLVLDSTMPHVSLPQHISIYSCRIKSFYKALITVPSYVRLSYCIKSLRLYNLRPTRIDLSLYKILRLQCPTYHDHSIYLSILVVYNLLYKAFITASPDVILCGWLSSRHQLTN